MWRGAAVLAGLLLIAWDASVVSPHHKLDLLWLVVVALLLLRTLAGREWAWILLMTTLTTYATLILLGNLRNPEAFARRGLPVAIAVTVVGFSSRSLMSTSQTRRAKAPAANP